MKLRDIISPFYAWKRAFEKPFTIMKPRTEREGPAGYRGFHVNDLGRCVGCGTCEAICQNAAIDMVELAGGKVEKGNSSLRPSIDYGRCCWCALCVDVCPTGSLGMSNEYNWISDDGEDWVFVPGAEQKKWDAAGKGYRSTPESAFVEPVRAQMRFVEPEVRKNNFDEMTLGFTDETAREEAMRCIACGLCIEACPTHMDVPSYIRAIRDGDLEEGLRILYDTNPFSESCGRVCTAHCETACPVGAQGKPLAIRWLKRYITDSTLDIRDDILETVDIAPTGKKVAVIGAGPAGLTAAFYLRHYGHEVTVYEQNERPGGMLLTGIPQYRLPDEVLEREIAVIEKTGVKIRTGVRIGRDITAREVLGESDAVFFSVGAQTGTDMPVEGMDLEGVHIGIDFLDRIARGERPDCGEVTVVVGGGNTAMDVARSAVRLGSGVKVLYRRSEKEMPANAEEIEEAREEGVSFDLLTTPEKITREGGRLHILCRRMRLGPPDSSGRRTPEAIEGSEFTVVADTCVMAIGQKVEQELAREAGVELDKWGNYHADRRDMKTNVPGVFAGGDCETGPDDAVGAIASGKRAAFRIDEHLRQA
ncbi:MAG TPA: FAD-dependent oxidoreductase [Candidatus Krumholzibacterium sp.]|nr:FAD-dependent oxidoreductase [Candidatus Krumholzibacterium sp.]